MASSAVKEINHVNKGRTGGLTIRKRKQKGMKAKPWGKATPTGHFSSPTDKKHGKGVASKAKPQ